MKTNILLKIFSFLTFIATFLPAFSNQHASGTVVTLPVEDVCLSRYGDVMKISMDLRLDNFHVEGKEAYLITPYIKNGNDSLLLQPIGVYSRNRWYYYQRNNMILGGPEAVSMRYSKHLESLPYSREVQYADWMDGSHVAVKGEVYSCANCLVEEEIVDFDATYSEFHPMLVFAPVTEVLDRVDVIKRRELSGRAYIDFPVNQIIIYPDYRNNPLELAKIIATIDSVRNDPDVTVNSIHIAGTASPEGPYDNNIRLAKGRTEALKTYVQRLYKFPEGFITTSYEPVDWKGLEEFLVNGPVGPAYAAIADVNLSQVLPNREKILNIVRGNTESYQRNQNIKINYPKEYDWLLKNVYPALRHSDYTIEYTIREFTETAEISEQMRINPSKLTFKEMMRLADTLEPGSEEYNDVFELAVRLYPDEPVANLNVANSALNRGDLVTAARYLPKAGNSPQAIFSRANLAFMEGKYQEAKELYRQAAESLPEAQIIYQQFLDAGY